MGFSSQPAKPASQPASQPANQHVFPCRMGRKCVRIGTRVARTCSVGYYTIHTRMMPHTVRTHAHTSAHMHYSSHPLYAYMPVHIKRHSARGSMQRVASSCASSVIRPWWRAQTRQILKRSYQLKHIVQNFHYKLIGTLAVQICNAFEVRAFRLFSSVMYRSDQIIASRTSVLHCKDSSWVFP